MVLDYEKYASALSMLYEDKVTAYIEKVSKDPIKKIQKRELVKVVDNEPCRLSFNVSRHQGSKIGYTEYEKVDILTTPHNVVIPVGSDIEVTKLDGTVYKYTYSEEPSVHSSHRRYILSKANKS